MATTKMLPVLLFAALACVAQAYHECDKGETHCVRDPQVLPRPYLKMEDQQVELRNIYTDRQGGARINILVKYRYYSTGESKDYTTETGTFDYRDMTEALMKWVPDGAYNLSGSTYWEIVVREMADSIWDQFPIRGLALRVEIQGMSTGGDMAHRASSVTMGDMEPWGSMAISFPGCDGMSTDLGNKACIVTPTWAGDKDTASQAVVAAAKAKAGKHDKPTDCDFCD